jgi:hypothetical protein
MWQSVHSHQSHVLRGNFSEQGLPESEREKARSNIFEAWQRDSAQQARILKENG